MTLRNGHENGHHVPKKKRATADRVPHNLPAERSFLSGVFFAREEAGAALRDAGEISATDFHDLRHRKIFETFLALIEDGEPVHPVTVKDRLGEDLAEVGEQLIDELEQEPPASGNLSYYAKNIREKARRRALILALEQLALTARDGHATPAKMLEFHRQSIAPLLDAVDGDDARGRPFAERVAALLREKIPEPTWLIPGYLQEKSIALMAGPPQAGKTLLVIDWAAKIVADGRRVFLAQNEGTRHALQQRLRRACAAANLDVVPDRFTFKRNVEISLADPAAVRKLATAIGPQDLTIFDSLASFYPGLDENNPAQMSLAAESLKVWSEITEGSTLAVHHPTKNWKPTETPTLADIRGHGSMGGRIDAAFFLAPGDRVAGVVRFELHVVKQRDGDWLPPSAMEVLMTGPAAVVTGIGDGVVVRKKTKTGRNPHRTNEELKADVLKYVRTQDKPLTQNAICNDVLGTRARVAGVVKDFIKAGVLTRDADDMLTLADRFVSRFESDSDGSNGKAGVGSVGSLPLPLGGRREDEPSRTTSDAGTESNHEPNHGEERERYL